MKNMVSITIKEIKHAIRNSKSTVMMVVFPIIMIIILSLVLSKAFDNTSQTVSGVKILYSVNGSSPLSQAFKSMVKQAAKSGFQFTQKNDIVTTIPDMNKTGYACYVQMSDNTSNIMVYENSRLHLEASIAEAILSTFVQRYNVMTEISRENPAALQKIVNTKSDRFVNIESLEKDRTPSSLDYYTIAMIALFIMYSSISALWAINRERVQKTGSRILSSPVKKYQMLSGKAIGVTIVTFFQMAIVFIFAKFIMHAYMGSYTGAIVLLYTSEIIMAVCIGIGVSFMVSDINLASGIVNIIPVVFGFLGGAYVPLSSMGSGFIQKLSVISPIKWTNDALLKVIYSNDFSQVAGAVIINLSLAAIFIIASSVIFSKEAL